MARRELRESTAMKLAEPDTLTDILDHISTGGTLSEYTNDNHLAYMMVRDFLNSTPDIAKAYAAAQASRDGYLTDKVLSSLRNVADVDVRDAFDQSGKVKAIADLPDDIAQSITSIELSYNKDGDEVQKFKFVPRDRAYDMLGKHLGMFKERLELTGANGGPMMMEEGLTNEAARRVAFMLTKAAKEAERTKP